MIKRLLSLFLAVLMAFSCISVVSAVEEDPYAVGTVAADDTMTKLDYLIRKYPHGKYWNHMGSSKNNPEGVTDTPCSSHSNCQYDGSCSATAMTEQFSVWATLIRFPMKSRVLTVCSMRKVQLLTFQSFAWVTSSALADTLSVLRV